ncbi:MAG: 2'-5' RNA ligase family protein [Candidatus Pacebacteria bacterium]|jgi:2'-5' RNA ligase|nr:2'-5' RNA ligase family protein [Candidatus Paceibacterota bacterium]
MRYSIVHLPEGTVKRYHYALVQDIAKRFSLSVNTEFFPTHVTLKSPFEKADLMLTKIELEKFARAHHPHPFVVHGFGHFETDTIFLDVSLPRETERAVEGLRNAIRKQIPETSWKAHESRKHFHITVAKGVDEKFWAIWEYVNKKQVPEFVFPFNNVALLCLDGGKLTVDTIHHIDNKHR